MPNDKSQITQQGDGMSETAEPYVELRAEVSELGNIVGKMITDACNKYGVRSWYYQNVAEPAISNYYDAVYDGIKQKHGLAATIWRKP